MLELTTDMDSKRPGATTKCTTTALVCQPCWISCSVEWLIAREFLVAWNGIDVVEKIKGTHAPFYRPALPERESEDMQPGIVSLMRQCWDEEPSERPSFDEVIKSLKIINKGKLAYQLLYLFCFHSAQLRMSECSIHVRDKSVIPLQTLLNVSRTNWLRIRLCKRKFHRHYRPSNQQQSTLSVYSSKMPTL